MNNYELMFIVRPTLDEASIKKVYEDMQNVVTKANGKIVLSKEMGQRDLAYEIEGHKKGYYFLLVVEAKKETVSLIDGKQRFKPLVYANSFTMV